MEKENPDSKPAARQSSSTPTSKTRSKAPKWPHGSTPLTTQLPTPAMEDQTPLAISNITCMYSGKPKDTSSTRSIISSIETAVPATIPSYEPPFKTTSFFGSIAKPSPGLFGIKKNTSSTTSIEGKPTGVINPVDCFTIYAVWLKMNFPEHIQTRDIFFVTNILMMNSYTKVSACAIFSPQER